MTALGSSVQRGLTLVTQSLTPLHSACSKNDSPAWNFGILAEQAYCRSPLQHPPNHVETLATTTFLLQDRTWGRKAKAGRASLFHSPPPALSPTPPHRPSTKVRACDFTKLVSMTPIQGKHRSKCDPLVNHEVSPKACFDKQVHDAHVALVRSCVKWGPTLEAPPVQLWPKAHSRSAFCGRSTGCTLQPSGQRIIPQFPSSGNDEFQDACLRLRSCGTLLGLCAVRNLKPRSTDPPFKRLHS